MMDMAFDERVQLALKVLASVYGSSKGRTVATKEIQTLKSNLGAEDWTGMPPDQIACAVIERELKRTQPRKPARRRTTS